MILSIIIVIFLSVDQIFNNVLRISTLLEYLSRYYKIIEKISCIILL